MLVYLMRHGIAEGRERRAHDRDRELTPEGVQKTTTAAAFPAPSGGGALPPVSLHAYVVVFYSFRPGKTPASGRGQGHPAGRWVVAGKG